MDCGWWWTRTVYHNKYAHGFVVLCFVVVMQSFIMNSHEVFIHIHQGCFAGTGAIVRLPQCQWSKPDGYGKISQCITTTKHSKAKTVCIFFGIYCKSECCHFFHSILCYFVWWLHINWRNWAGKKAVEETLFPRILHFYHIFYLCWTLKATCIVAFRGLYFESDMYCSI